MSDFTPRLQILPEPQRRLWPELCQVPPHFVLYGGTAVALWLGHRQSVDFDFFTSVPFLPEGLMAQMPFLNKGTPLQSAPNTLTLLLKRVDEVKISFFGGLTFGRVGHPGRSGDIGLAIASRLDLAATKCRVMIERAERKDYLDIAALLNSGITLPGALAAARALYGEQFNPMITLKALCYFIDGDLPKLPEHVKQLLSIEAGGVSEIPLVSRISDHLAPEI